MKADEGGALYVRCLPESPPSMRREVTRIIDPRASRVAMLLELREWLAGLADDALAAVAVDGGLSPEIRQSAREERHRRGRFESGKPRSLVPVCHHQKGRVMFAIGDTEYPGISKLVEECGELLQACGKLMATHGEPAHWDGSDLRVRLVQEMADVYAAISFVRNVVLSPQEERTIERRAAEKLAAFYRWHRDQRSLLPERSEDCDRSHLVSVAAIPVSAAAAAIPVKRMPGYLRRLCQCDWMCPLGRSGRVIRCTESELRAAGVKVQVIE